MRDLIDFAVAKEVVALLRERFNNGEQPLGHAVATAALVMTSMALQEGSVNDQKRLASALALIDDLVIDGWDLPADVEHTQ